MINIIHLIILIYNIYKIEQMKRSSIKAKFSPMEHANVYSVQFTTMPQDVLVLFDLITEKLDGRIGQGFKIIQWHYPQP